MNHLFKLAAAGAVGLLLSIGSAQAAQIKCVDGSGRVMPTSDCEFSDSVNNDKIPGGAAQTVNEEEFFGFDDWIFDGRDNAPDGGTVDFDGVDAGGPNTLGLVLDGDTKSGEWELTNLTSLAGLQVMLVFKGGNARPARVIAFLVSDIMGSYNSPFFNSNDDVKDISHVTAYYREVPEIPVPAAIWLMGAGLAGLGFAGRRKKNV